MSIPRLHGCGRLTANMLQTWNVRGWSKHWNTLLLIEADNFVVIDVCNVWNLYLAKAYSTLKSEARWAVAGLLLSMQQFNDPCRLRSSINEYHLSIRWGRIVYRVDFGLIKTKKLKKISPLVFGVCVCVCVCVYLGVVTLLEMWQSNALNGQSTHFIAEAKNSC